MHLLIALSGHGLGHLAQIGPVVNALVTQNPQYQITVMTAVPLALLQARITVAFELWPLVVDPGMAMHNALSVDVAASVAAYQAFHADWDDKVRALTQQLASRAVDLIIADVPYQVLAAAAPLHIPSVALCSLNWADIYAGFAPANAQTQRILQQIQHAYAQAHCFLQPEPSMAMPELRLMPIKAIGPIAQMGQNRQHEIKHPLGLAPTAKLVLVSLGGIDTPLPLHQWPVIPDVFWIVPTTAEARQHPQALALSAIAWPFVDILCSVDAFLTKPGYGSFAESVCNGIPLIFVRRDHWPEQEALIQWVMAHGVGYEIDWQQLQQGELQAALHWAFALGRQAPRQPTGIAQCVQLIQRLPYKNYN